MSRNQGLEATLSFGVPPNLEVVCSWGFLDLFGAKKAQNQSYNDFEKTEVPNGGAPRIWNHFTPEGGGTSHLSDATPAGLTSPPGI